YRGQDPVPLPPRFPWTARGGITRRVPEAKPPGPCHRTGDPPRNKIVSARFVPQARSSILPERALRRFSTSPRRLLVHSNLARPRAWPFSFRPFPRFLAGRGVIPRAGLASSSSALPKGQQRPDLTQRQDRAARPAP